MSIIKYIPLLIETRNHIKENIHFGSLYITDKNKNAIAELGDCDEPVFFRSASKPFQAIPVFMSRAIEHFNITKRESAIFIGSQRGELEHQEVLSSLQEKLAINDDDLVCAPSYPLNENPKIEYICKGLPKRRLFHNCGGKHLGLLAYCKKMGHSIENYQASEHPLMVEIIRVLSYLSEVPEDEVVLGVDGCGLPNYAIPLKNMALAYLKLAQPDLIEDEAIRMAVIQLTKVMNDHPTMIASEDFICSNLLRDANIVAKGGAQGVYCLALKEEGISIALKVKNGAEEPWSAIILSILEQLNYPNTALLDRLRTLSQLKIVNDEGREVGERIAAFEIN